MLTIKMGGLLLSCFFTVMLAGYYYRMIPSCNEYYLLD